MSYSFIPLLRNCAPVNQDRNAPMSSIGLLFPAVYLRSGDSDSTLWVSDQNRELGQNGFEQGLRQAPFHQEGVCSSIQCRLPLIRIHGQNDHPYVRPIPLD